MYPNIHPGITVYTGPMFAGKTTRLQQQLATYRVMNKTIVVVKHCCDTRYSATKVTQPVTPHTLTPFTQVTTHDGTGVPATFIVPDLAPVLSYAIAHKPDVVAIDDAHFFPNIADAASTMANMGAHVVIAALDSNFLNHPTSTHFSNIAELLPR